MFNYYYCYPNEIDGTLICYFGDEICTYYPDGTVDCVPRASLDMWGIPMETQIFM